MPAVVNRRGQITIDRTAREQLGVHPGMIAVQQVIRGQLVVTFIPAPHNRSVAGILGAPPRPVNKTWEQIEDQIAQAIADDAMGVREGDHG